MATTRTDNIHQSFDKVATMAFDNIPKDIAFFMIIYVRDKSTDENWWDWTIDIRTINKNMMYYDWASVREYIDHHSFEIV